MTNTHLFRRRLKSKPERCRLYLFILFYSTVTAVSPAPITNKGTTNGDTWTVVTDWPNSVDQVSSRTAWTWSSSSNPPSQFGAQSWNFDPRKDDILNWENKLGTDDVDMATSVVEVIVYIVTALVLLSFASFLICICCPICVFAKSRRRRRGHVHGTATAVTPAVATTLTSTTTQAPQMIAISNARVNCPYPVQETVTVIPLVSQQPFSYTSPGFSSGEGTNYGVKPPAYCTGASEHGTAPLPTEPPPPYSGPSSGNSDLPQHPYNPYFSEGAQNINK